MRRRLPARLPSSSLYSSLGAAGNTYFRLPSGKMPFSEWLLKKKGKGVRPLPVSF